MTHNVFPVYRTNENSNYYRVKTIYDGIVLQKADTTTTNIVFNKLNILHKLIGNGDKAQTNIFSYDRNIFFTNQISLKKISGKISYAAMVIDRDSGGSGYVDKSAILPSAARNSSYRYALKNGSAVFPAGVSIDQNNGKITVSAGSGNSSNTYTITATVSNHDLSYAGAIEGQVSLQISKTSYNIQYVGFVSGVNATQRLIISRDGKYVYSSGRSLKSYHRNASTGMLTLKQNFGNAGDGYLSKNENYLYVANGGNLKRYNRNSSTGNLSSHQSLSFSSFTNIHRFYSDGICFILMAVPITSDNFLF